MCQYSAINGVPNEWHLVHLGSRAVGGAGIVIAEATAVSPEGRITPGCTGIWNDEQMLAWKKIASFIKAQGAVAGIQLAHAGRKASMDLPWKGSHLLTLKEGGWPPLAPSAIAYSDSYAKPEAMIDSMIEKVVVDFSNAAERAIKAGFDVIEIHSAHGYLLHEFLSPISNQRSDNWGGSLENRMRLVVTIAKRLRKIWPEDQALFTRISATDWVENGWDLDSSIVLAKALKEAGVDLIDVSSGGLAPHQKIKTGPLYQADFAAKIRNEALVSVAAVGEITRAAEANSLINEKKADLVLLGREFLRDPYWPKSATIELKQEITSPNQYLRAW